MGVARAIFSPLKVFLLLRQFISESVFYLSRRKLNLLLWLSGRSDEERNACPVGCRAVLQPVGRYQ
jgi:hypothetical protein